MLVPFPFKTKYLFLKIFSTCLLTICYNQAAISTNQFHLKRNDAFRLQLSIPLSPQPPDLLPFQTWRRCNECRTNKNCRRRQARKKVKLTWEQVDHGLLPGSIQQSQRCQHAHSPGAIASLSTPADPPSKKKVDPPLLYPGHEPSGGGQAHQTCCR